MNVELIQTLGSIQSRLQTAANSVINNAMGERSEGEACTSGFGTAHVDFLLTRIQSLCVEIDEMIVSEEAVLDDMFAAYQREKDVPAFSAKSGGKGSDDGKADIFFHINGNGVYAVAADIRKAFDGCYVNTEHTTYHTGDEKVVISAQPNGQFTPDDIALLLKGRGYDVTFLEAKKLEHSKWAYFDVAQNGFKFEFHSTVASLEALELERFDEPASDSHLVT